MAKLSTKTSAVLLMLIFAMISSVPREAEAGKLTISWPKWHWCFPQCVLGQTCFFKVFKYCRLVIPDAVFLNCVVVALEWCDLDFFSIDKLVIPPMPPSAYALEGEVETSHNGNAGSD